MFVLEISYRQKMDKVNTDILLLIIELYFDDFVVDEKNHKSKMIDNNSNLYQHTGWFMRFCPHLRSAFLGAI